MLLMWTSIFISLLSIMHKVSSSTYTAFKVCTYAKLSSKQVCSMLKKDPELSECTTDVNLGGYYQRPLLDITFFSNAKNF